MRRLELMQTNRPAEVVRTWLENDDLELSPPYQRGDVWGVTRRRNLIKSMLMGVPIPSIIVNNRLHVDFFGTDGSTKIAVIDGKQRLTTICMFLKGDLSVPSVWFESRAIDLSRLDSHEGMITYNDLTIVGKRKFKNIGVAFSEAALESLEAEREVFDLVNFGGLRQGEVDSESD